MPDRAEFVLEIQGGGSQWEVELPPGETMIGRAPGHGVHLPDTRVSSNHARINNNGQSCTIVDTDSRNGTKVNRQSLQPGNPRVLQDGDEIEVVMYTLIFHAQATAVDSAGSRPEAIPVDEPPVPAQRADTPVQQPPQPPAQPPATQPQTGVPYEGEVPPGLSRHSIRLLQYLPEIYHAPVPMDQAMKVGAGEGDCEGNFLSRLLAIMESILLPVDWTVDNFDLFLGVYTAPDEFLPWLFGWYGIVFDMTWSNAARRAFLAEASALFAMRGTRRALTRVLELYLGSAPTIIEERADLPPHHFVVKLSRRPANETLLRALINANKPAHTMYTLEY